jgi:pimeloyl-ACP methyl ester carboxylesterase
MPTFSYDGLNFQFLETGSGVPFFFQHGLGGETSLVFALFKPPPGVRLIGLDARGHGETRPLGAPARIGLASFADDLLALMDHLKIARAVIGGISMGAAITLNFALRFPDRVLGLVQSRPAWLDFPQPENVEVFGLIAQFIRQHGAQRGREFFIKHELYQRWRREFPDAANSLISQFNHPRADETVVKFERIPRDAPCHDRAEWSRIKVPTLVLANRLDPIHPFEYGETIARLIPGAEFHELTSKSLSLEQHEADVNRHLTAFLQRHFL